MRAPSPAVAKWSRKPASMSAIACVRFVLFGSTRHEYLSIGRVLVALPFWRDRDSSCLPVPSEVWHNSEQTLNDREMRTMLHFMFLGSEEHLKATL